MFEANVDCIDLSLLDIVMPKMMGRDVFRAIRNLSPQAKVAFCSGYDPDISCNGFVASEGLQMIPKPFGPDVLLKTVRSILDEEADCPTSPRELIPASASPA